MRIAIIQPLIKPNVSSTSFPLEWFPLFYVFHANRYSPSASG